MGCHNSALDNVRVHFASSADRVRGRNRHLDLRGEPNLSRELREAVGAEEDRVLQEANDDAVSLRNGYGPQSHSPSERAHTRYGLLQRRRLQSARFTAQTRNGRREMERKKKRKRKKTRWKRCAE